MEGTENEHGTVMYDCGGMVVEVSDLETLKLLKGMYPDAEDQPCPPPPKL